MGIPALREALLSTFLGDMGPRIARLEEAVAKGDARLTEFEAHGLEGMSATVGAVRCARLFAEIEQLGRDESLAGAPAKIQMAKLAVTETEQHLKRLERILSGTEATK